MEPGEILFTVECPEPSGPVVRSVRQAALSVERLRYYHDRLGRFETIFNEYVGRDFESYLSIFVRQEGDDLFATSLVWEVDDVGLLYLTDMRPSFDALAHFTFWDGRMRGRAPLLREAAVYAIKCLGFHRITAEIPMYIKPVVLSVVEQAGFVKEGRKRAVSLYRGNWFDATVYSLLDSEV